ncbi:hypothetical protein [Nannocystis sp. SCPEA4]|uniref:hypothetical protein n=1 Tax=Nannocystis sp. SCPEA4 TaxID=2996787 RepID=UPI00226DE751|nr:hypothetical protein [Nannocystis sp. SCPEA4]MCY1060144.1 hypothetical protein [Nannocystis sp. SCPEA4]
MISTSFSLACDWLPPIIGESSTGAGTIGETSGGSEGSASSSTSDGTEDPDLTTGEDTDPAASVGEPPPGCLPLDQPFVGDVDIDGPGDVAQLAGYSRISGHLAIWGPGIGSLEPLYCLKKVNQLTLGGGDLTSLHGLENLEVITTAAELGMNSELVDFQGLNGLVQAQAIHIYKNPKLTSLDGLGGVVSLPSAISVAENDNLQSLDALTSLSHVGVFHVRSNASLVELDLPALSSIGASLEVFGNPSLPSCDAHALVPLVAVAQGACILDNLPDGCADTCW